MFDMLTADVTKANWVKETSALINDYYFKQFVYIIRCSSIFMEAQGLDVKQRDSSDYKLIDLRK